MRTLWLKNRLLHNEVVPLRGMGGTTVTFARKKWAGLSL